MFVLFCFVFFFLKPKSCSAKFKACIVRYHRKGIHNFIIIIIVLLVYYAKVLNDE